MTERLSNAEFLMVEPRLPTEASGWEVRVISPHDWTTVIGYVRNWRKLGGSKAVNDVGSGSIELNTNNPILSTPFPAGLPGTIRSGEFLWQFWRDGLLRHEWISDDEKENEVFSTSKENVISFAGRTLEKVLEWGIHYPVWGERQSYDITGEPTGGTYRLAWGDHITPPIAWNATAAEVLAALESLPTINPGDVTVRRGNSDGTQNDWRYSMQFMGALTGIDVPRLQMASNGLTGGNEPTLDIPEANSNNTWEDLNSTILGQPAIVSVITFLERCQSRGVLPFLSLTFTATHDSAGMPWSDLTDVTVSPGETLMELLQRLSDMCQWEFKVISGFRLWIVQDTYGVNRSSTVQFFKAGQQVTHERISSSRDVATDIYTQSSKFEIAHTSGASEVTVWKREAWIEAGGSPSISSASLVGNATLAIRKDKKVSRTLSVPPELPTRKVFIDYDVSDTVALETNDGMEHIKIVGISFSSDPDLEFGLELVIQSAFEAREVRTQKALEKMGSKSATGGAGSSPTGPPPITRAMGLKDLTDVRTAGVIEGDILVREGGSWVRVQPTLDHLSDVDTAAVVDGKALVWDSAAGMWKPGSPSYTVEVQWAEIQGKPTTFPPDSHTHLATAISDSTAVGRSVMRAVDAAAARTAIGAGTSSLALGTTSTTAKAGNWVPAWSDVTSKPATFEPIAKGLDWLTDVDTATTVPANGQALVWDAASNLWKPGTVSGGSGGGASTLDELSDVDVASAAAGVLLGFDGTDWIPVTIGEGGSVGYPTGPQPTGLNVVVGDTTGVASSGEHPKSGTQLNVRVPGRLTRLAYRNTYVALQSLWIDGVKVGASYSPNTSVGAWDIDVWLDIGVHSVEVRYDSGSLGVWVRAVSSIDYVVDGVDMTAVGFNGLNTHTPPFIYTFAPALPPSDTGVLEIELNRLVDVDTATTAPTEGQTLLWDDTAGVWKPGTVSGGGGSSTLDGLTDVDTTGVIAGQVLAYDDVTSSWLPATVEGGTGGATSQPADALLAHQKYGSGAAVATTMAAGYLPAAQFPDLVFTLQADAVIRLRADIYTLMSSGTADFWYAISPDNWTTAYWLDPYQANQPPASWQIQYSKYRLQPNSNYQTFELNDALLKLPAGTYQVRIYRGGASNSFTWAEHAGKIVALALAVGSGGDIDTVQTDFVTSPDVSGNDSSSAYASASTTLTVRKAMTLNALRFRAIDAATYSLVIGGETLGSQVASANSDVIFSGFTKDLAVGEHEVKIVPSVNAKVRYRSVASILYSGAGFDFTAAGWKEVAGNYTLPFVYTGYSLEEKLNTTLDELADVDVTTSAPSHGQTLVYDDFIKQWKPGTISGGGGGGGSGEAYTLIAEPSHTSFASWVGLAGNWSSNGTEIVQTGTATARAMYNVRLPMAGPVIVDWEMKLDSAGGTGTDRHAGIILGFGGTNATGGALARMLWDGASAFSLQMEQDGVTSRLSRVWSLTTDTWFRFRVIWSGYSMTFYCNGSLIGTAGNMSTHTAPQYLGLKSNGTPSRFRNIKVYAPSMPITADFPASPGGRTALVNYPPNLAAATLTTGSSNFRGTYFISTATSSVKELRFRCSAVAGRTYKVGIYELDGGRGLITAVAGEADIVAAASGDQTLTATVDIPLVPGKAYLLAGGSAAGCTHYYLAFGAVTDSPVTTTIYTGGSSPGRMPTATPAVGVTLTNGSDYFCLGMTVDY